MDKYEIVERVLIFQSYLHSILHSWVLSFRIITFPSVVFIVRKVSSLHECSILSQGNFNGYNSFLINSIEESKLCLDSEIFYVHTIEWTLLYLLFKEESFKEKYFRKASPFQSNHIKTILFKPFNKKINKDFVILALIGKLPLPLTTRKLDKIYQQLFRNRTKMQLLSLR